MSTSTHVTARKRLPAKTLNALSAALRADAIAIFPTETVYGLGANVFSRIGIQRIYKIKGRAWKKPLAVLVHTLEAAAPLVETIPPEALCLAKKYMPGPLTIVLKASPIGRIAMGGHATIGIRIPDHPIALQILHATGVPLATTSVNKSGEMSITSGATAKRHFGTTVDWVVDGGPCEMKTPSTVVDLSHYPFTIVRVGTIAKKTLEKILGL